jgi:hypothetical protein
MEFINSVAFLFQEIFTIGIVVMTALSLCHGSAGAGNWDLSAFVLGILGFCLMLLVVWMVFDVTVQDRLNVFLGQAPIVVPHKVLPGIHMAACVVSIPGGIGLWIYGNSRSLDR